MWTLQHKVLIGAVLVVTLHEINTQKNAEPICTNRIYCKGKLLKTVQMARINDDSKTFVDMKLKRSPNETLQRFDDFMAQHGGNPSKEDTRQFVTDNFDPSGLEFSNFTPPDFTDSPKFLDNIRDEHFRQFGINLNDLWKILGRKIKDDVAINPQLYSMIYVENPVIVPGGRFRELYYWDSYWIIKGLLHSEMHSTAKGMIQNFFSIIERYGFMPNGGRIYYLTRTQPPLLIQMVMTYIDMTGDYDFMSEALPYIVTEFEFFVNYRTVEVNGRRLFTYGTSIVPGPRPESYYEDVQTAQYFQTESEKDKFYVQVNAGAESGMDFSSRWFVTDGSNAGELHDIQARYIVPVELNSIMYYNAISLAELHEKLGNTNEASMYKQRAQEIYDAVDAILWNEEAGTWFDYDLIYQKPRSYFAATNISPIYFGCFNKSNSALVARKTLAYINSTGIDSYTGGVPTTLMNTGQQWDYPNAWAPLQYWLTEGFRNLNDKDATALADRWTNRWTNTNYKSYNQTNVMFEKYSAEGGNGGGGEYNVQVGFGWTNGVAIHYLATRGDILTLD